MIARRLFITLAAACALAACQAQSERGDPAAEVIIAIGADPVSLDPANTSSSFDGAILDLLYQQLTAVDATSQDGRIMGELAESWTFSEDGLTLTFVLREGPAFADGTPVTAQAVKYSFDRIRAVGRAADQTLYWLGGVEAVDARTVQMTLTQPFPAAPMMLALPSFSIVNPSVVQANAGTDNALAWLGANTAGSGPFQLSAWRRGQDLTLTANPNASTKPRQFERVVFSVIPNDGTRRLKLERGDVDYVGGLGAVASRNYASIPDVVVARADFTMDMRFITINTKSPALADRRVRQAIAMAIDYEALRNDVLAGQVGPMTGYLPANVPGARSDRPPQTRDLDGARRLLAEAGYDPSVALRMMVTAYGPVAEFIQAQLREAGLNVTLQRLAPSAIQATRATGDFDLFYDGWVMDVPDPAIFFNLAFSTRYIESGVNASRFGDPAFDAALDAALAQTDPVARAAAYGAIEARLLEERPVVMLYATLPLAAHRRDLQGVRMNPYQTTYMNIIDWTRAP
ncbi:MAG: ABC transporter substrate-binding protein [Hyphomonadaceae bacterium]|nr:ABC transporter substrate-binding protein [Hyphomonadaceae bacterium]